MHFQYMHMETLKIHTPKAYVFHVKMHTNHFYPHIAHDHRCRTVAECKIEHKHTKMGILTGVMLI